MLHCIVGTMKSSKSSHLIDYTEVIKPKKFIIFYPSCCEKKPDYVISRDNDKQAKAIKIFEIQDMYQHIQNIDVIFIDEFQFLTGSSNIDDFMEFIEFCDKNKKEVYLFGLALDYKANAFDITSRVLPYADTIMVLHANCDICGAENKATRCIRYKNGELDLDLDAEILAMESDTMEYKSVCTECFRNLTQNPAIK